MVVENMEIIDTAIDKRSLISGNTRNTHVNPDWHEDDNFWKDIAPYFFSHKRWMRAEEDVSGLIRLLQITPGQRVLDLACGPGIHILELAKRGFLVTGVDRTQELLSEAKMKAELDGLQLQLIAADMRSFMQQEAFDAVLSIGISFGYFSDINDDYTVVHNIFESLKSGGKLLIDIVGKEVMARGFSQKSWDEFSNGLIILEKLEVTPDWVWMEVFCRFLKGASSKDFQYRSRMYAASELQTLLQEIGFVNIKFYGALDGRPYNVPWAERLIVTAQRPD